MAQIGDVGVDLLISDSTNAQKRGFTLSETTVANLLTFFRQEGNKRIVVASFATNVPRIQQIFVAAKTYSEK
jgi:ribonuclease J